MKAFAFSDDEDVSETDATDAQPSYAVEGFKLEFSDKVALTPRDAELPSSAPR